MDLGILRTAFEFSEPTSCGVHKCYFFLRSSEIRHGCSRNTKLYRPPSIDEKAGLPVVVGDIHNVVTRGQYITHQAALGV
jgi:hypothetical protein